MHKIKVIVDSTVDISMEKLKELDVDMLPLSVLIHGEEYLDLEQIKWYELIEKINKYNELPKTSAINVEKFMEIFYKYTRMGYEVIFLSLGANFSSNYSNACFAASSFENGVYVLDSQNLSSAIGLQLLKIKKFQSEGLSAKEIVEKMGKIIPLTQTETALETMEYLYKGGRCGSLKYFISNILKLNPIVKVNDGVIKVHKITRGKFQKSLDTIANDFKKDLDNDNVDLDYIIISTVGNTAGQEYLYKKISTFFNPTHILLFDAGCVVSSHCGPGTTGFFYIKKGK